MSDQRGRAGPDPVPYPDIARAGDLRRALQGQFDAAGLACRARHVSSPGWRHVAARVVGVERDADVVTGIGERAFCLRLRARGVGMARGTTVELSGVAAAMHAWQSGVRLRQLVSAWPFLRTDGFAEAYERGDAEAIGHRWRQYHEDPSQARQLTRLRPFVAHAFREPRLRALLPYTSHRTLRFSRTVSLPYSDDCPFVEPLRDGRYLVRAADGRELGTADAAGGVALVLAALDASAGADDEFHVGRA
ncbi:hypothetical protein GA0070606_0323 [Micromonospora citrea]|uniref:Uncharacterized protein n=1 Tax=Micromonospora citrea TaxID=47855 RepID=A0A1C6TRS5_9ACTN|nr:DUF6193 family natural product biosynthesis protein [Micromonospora citrea]SCL44506.1 hypothetical protein GA0070606_0323 [Micromonospora citrea]